MYFRIYLFQAAIVLIFLQHIESFLTSKHNIVIWNGIISIKGIRVEENLDGSVVFEDNKKLDTLLYILSEKQEDKLKYLSKKPDIIPFTLSSINNLIGEAPSFQSLSNNIKSIPTESKPTWLPGLNAWRVIIDHEDIVNADEKDLAPPTLSSYLHGHVKLSDKHQALVADLWSNLKRGSLQNLTDINEEPIIEALRIAYIGLWGKKAHRSMENSINQATGTAAVIAELFGGGNASINVIIAGILHEVLYASSDCYDQVKAGIVKRFGVNVWNITDHYHDLPKFKALKVDYTPIQAEHMIQMLVASCEVYATLYIRLADRIYSMRHILEYPLNDSERVKIAQEAINVYAPLAHKMNLLAVKEELEDLAFLVINPDMYKKCEITQIQAHNVAAEAKALIEDEILSDPYVQSHGKAELYSRVKSKYQIYLKMERKNMSSLYDLKDAIGLRLIFHPNHTFYSHETEEEMEQRGIDLCYHMAERLKNLPGWKPDVKGTKDYIKEKKTTGYQSIHQFLYNENLKVAIEVQVRTMIMHCNAEIGEAAHWYYKDLTYRHDVAKLKSYRKAWRSESQIKANSAATILGLAREQLLKSCVFIYLNDHATVVSLEKGATALDAAFRVHSELGLSTSYVTVNGRPVELAQQLRNGDVISVQCTADGSIAAKQDWLHIVKTSSAIATLRLYFRNLEQSMNVTMGCIQFITMIAHAKHLKILLKPATLEYQRVRSGMKQALNKPQLLPLSSSSSSLSSISYGVMATEYHHIINSNSSHRHGIILHGDASSHMNGIPIRI